MIVVCGFKQLANGNNNASMLIEGLCNARIRIQQKLYRFSFTLPVSLPLNCGNL